MRIRKGDNIIVRTGADRGHRGKVIRVLRDANKVIVEGLNVVKRRQRPKKEGQKGQVIDVAMPIHVSNVALQDMKKGTGTRVDVKMAKGNKNKAGVAKKSGAQA